MVNQFRQALRLARVHGRGRIARLVAAGLVVATLGGCGCRPGYIGPYGGVHPVRCWFG